MSFYQVSDRKYFYCLGNCVLSENVRLLVYLMLAFFCGVLLILCCFLLKMPPVIFYKTLIAIPVMFLLKKPKAVKCNCNRSCMTYIPVVTTKSRLQANIGN